MAFIDTDFLLDTPQSRELYHAYAKPMPIIDFHSHLNPAWIAQDHHFQDITEAWLSDDHYKWRAMRTAGVPERYCTGDASPREKFDKWAATVPILLRNPLYHWTHLELRRIFGIDGLQLSPSTADYIWALTREKLSQPNFGARGIAQQLNVIVSCTTDDPSDPLTYHKMNNADRQTTITLLPTWRPDKARQVANAAAFRAWVEKLAQADNRTITTFSDLLETLTRRHAYFHEIGCRASDHSIEAFTPNLCTPAEAEAIFADTLRGNNQTPEAQTRYSFWMLHFFSTLDMKTDWVQQYHIGALRNPNAAALRRLGPDTGFDAIADDTYALPLALHLSRLAEANTLPRTILYNLNPRDNEMLAVLAGSFQDGTPGGRIQYGAAWWFLDQMDGLTRHIETLSQLGVLSQFVGMLTDSRSILSFTRHEYFRRILCRILGRDIADGLIPNDTALVGKMVRDISSHNAKYYFNFPMKESFT